MVFPTMRFPFPYANMTIAPINCPKEQNVQTVQNCLRLNTIKTFLTTIKRSVS